MDTEIKKAKSFVFYMIIGIALFIFGILIMPVWEDVSASLFFAGWSRALVDIMISGLLALYIGFYLVKRIRRYAGTPAQIVAIVELVLMVVIAVVCAVSFLDVVSLGNSCQIFGLAIWVRGAAGAFTGYFNNYQFKKEQSCEKKEKTENTSKKDTKKIEGASAKKSENTSDVKLLEGKKGKEKGVKGIVKSGEFTVWHLALAVFFISAGAYLFVRPPFTVVHLQWMFFAIVVCVGIAFFAYAFVVKARAKAIALNAQRDCTPSDNEQGATIKKDKTPKLPKEEVKVLDEAKVNIKLSETKEVNAMTNTAAYEKIDGENE